MALAHVQSPFASARGLYLCSRAIILLFSEDYHGPLYLCSQDTAAPACGTIMMLWHDQKA